MKSLATLLSLCLELEQRTDNKVNGYVAGEDKNKCVCAATCTLSCFVASCAAAVQMYS